ncbi:colanic acid biosynthesis glycosyltransferase WcaL [Acidocella aquatica]|uniref:Colanic acid biosynthesis glycosyltransferase WcaL n=1 Tax=Acidocella aquatica TaxID=1922313 RepID=A0ABQ6AAC2_9PROT|nr:glycosyltransferase [Acidocella aquatica]GLR67786.1 colanic acid biosynthesis glycosyltransferase WcaL [Acidocella aquatica]
MSSLSQKSAASAYAIAPGPVAYIMKRYPRLTETFIINEIRAMERLGADLRIFSLLQPEPPPHHPMVAQVAAPLYVLPAAWGAKLKRLAASHAKAFTAAPLRYLGATARALQWSATSSSPLAVWKHFVRAGYVATACRAQGIAHIHAHFANTPTAVAHFASLMSGIPFSFTAHAKDLYLTRKPIIARRTRAAEFVVTCTGYNARYLEDIQGHPAGKINLIYHGIDLDMFNARPAATPAQAAPPLILSVGRLVPKKGLNDLISACALLKASGIAFRCRIIGEGPLRNALQDQIKSAGLEDLVTLSGAMTHASLIALYATADLFALPPRIADDGDRDGIPNVIAEAMAIGLPVVSTDVSGIPELVRNLETGLLVPPRDPAALAQAMEQLLRDRPLALRLAAQGRALLERDFDLWTTTRRLHGLIACLDCAPTPRKALHADAPLAEGAQS